MALIANQSFATTTDPRFFIANGSSASVRALEMTFTYFNKLDEEQKRKYNGSIQFAIDQLPPGQFVKWYENNASGTVTVLYAERLNVGICKTILIQAIAYGVERRMTAKGCIPDDE